MKTPHAILIGLSLLAAAIWSPSAVAQEITLQCAESHSQARGRGVTTLPRARQTRVARQPRLRRLHTSACLHVWRRARHHNTKMALGRG